MLYYLLFIFCIASFCVVLFCVIYFRAPSSDFLLFNDTIFQFTKLLNKNVLLIANFRNITFLSSKVWNFLSSSSIFSDVTLSLVAFRAVVVISVALYSNGLRSSGLIVLVLFYPCVLANKALGNPPPPKPVLYNYPF